MHGRITKFNTKDGFGMIEADDGAKYRFAEGEVVNLDAKLVGHGVDFLLSARRPKEIILMTGSPWRVFSGTRH